MTVITDCILGAPTYDEIEVANSEGDAECSIWSFYFEQSRPGTIEEVKQTSRYLTLLHGNMAFIFPIHSKKKGW